MPQTTIVGSAVHQIRLDAELPRKAADSNATRERVKTRVLALFDQFGAMSDVTLTRRYWESPRPPLCAPDSPRKRRSELTADGILEPVGVERSGWNRPVTIWRLTEANEQREAA